MTQELIATRTFSGAVVPQDYLGEVAEGERFTVNTEDDAAYLVRNGFARTVDAQTITPSDTTGDTIPVSETAPDTATDPPTDAT